MCALEPRRSARHKITALALLYATVYDSLQTDMFIKAVEFENYKVGKPAELTICLKQFKVS